jgi:hypothetical protein
VAVGVSQSRSEVEPTATVPSMRHDMQTVRESCGTVAQVAGQHRRLPLDARADDARTRQPVQLEKPRDPRGPISTSPVRGSA